MKLSLNSIIDFNQRFKSTGDILAIGQDELLDRIGQQLGAIEEVIEIGDKYNGAVIVKVIECIKHPDADKLSLCRVDDGGTVTGVERGEDNLVQVVCGAPNVHEGMLAVWLPPGSTVPSSVGDDPFVLEARELRGKVSNGMLASPKELALGDSHEGLFVIDQNLKPGTPFGEAYGLSNDLIIDIENKMFTHRPDCFGMMGVARELAGIQALSFKSPDWYKIAPEFAAPDGEELPLEVVNELPELVPRFTMIVMRDVKVGPSPSWLQVELAKIGQKSINNIVDYTNYFMIETGQPLHAYDYDKVKALSGATPTIVVRNPHTDETVKLLNGKTIDPRQEAIMIATDKQLIGVGGIMGGSETEVDEATVNIILECGTFDMFSTRRTSMEHGLFTDAATRFTKGQSPLQNAAVQSRIVREIEQYAGGKVASRFFDLSQVQELVENRHTLYPPITIAVDFINDRLGLELDAKEISQILQNVEFKVENSVDGLTVTAPFWRTDIELREDIVEEVGRLYGFDKLPLSLPARDLTPPLRSQILDQKRTVRKALASAGANEVLTYSFVHGDLLKKVGQDPAQAYEISNALSPDVQFYRISLIPSLLDKVHPNIKAGYNKFALFEIGKTHGLAHQVDDEGLPREFEFTSLVITAADKLKQPGSAYYHAKYYLDQLTGHDVDYKPLPKEIAESDVGQPYNPKRSAAAYIKSSGLFLGIIGEFKQSVIRNLKLPRFIAGFEVDTEVLADAISASGRYQTLSKFPKVTQDITLNVQKEVSYSQLYGVLDQAINQAQPEDTITKLYPIDIFVREGDSARHITYRLEINSTQRTLTDKEVNKILDSAAEAAKQALEAQRI